MAVQAVDVAAYILAKTGKLSAMKLQKLVYYAQAWSLAWDDEPLFNDSVEAWTWGPVVPTLYRHHRGQYSIDVTTLAAAEPNPSALTQSQKQTIDSVLGFYGSMSASQLSELTHAEKPWQTAMAEKNLGDNPAGAISQTLLKAYYSTLGEDSNSVQTASEINFSA